MQLSVIIPVHNIARRGFDRLAFSLFSVRQNTLQPEVIVMDGSDQRERGAVAEICAEYGARHVPAPQPKYNMPMLFNAGMLLSRGDFIFCTGVDFLYHPDFFATLLKGADHNSFTVCPVRFLAKTQQITKDRITRWDLDLSMDNNLQAAGAKDWPDWCRRVEADGLQFFHRSWLEISQGYDETMYGMGGMDNQMHKRAKIYGLDCKWLDEVLVLHQWHEGKYAGADGQTKRRQSAKNWARRDKTKSVNWKNID